VALEGTDVSEERISFNFRAEITSELGTLLPVTADVDGKTNYLTFCSVYEALPLLLELRRASKMSEVKSVGAGFVSRQR
jgi:hypothetical protein